MQKHQNQQKQLTMAQICLKTQERSLKRVKQEKQQANINIVLKQSIPSKVLEKRHIKLFEKSEWVFSLGLFSVIGNNKIHTYQQQNKLIEEVFGMIHSTNITLLKITEKFKLKIFKLIEPVCMDSLVVLNLILNNISTIQPLQRFYLPRLSKINLSGNLITSLKSLRKFMPRYNKAKYNLPHSFDFIMFDFCSLVDDVFFIQGMQYLSQWAKMGSKLYFDFEFYGKTSNWYPQAYWFVKLDQRIDLSRQEESNVHESSGMTKVKPSYKKVLNQRWRRKNRNPWN